jgi:hypothetical protein
VAMLALLRAGVFLLFSLDTACLNYLDFVLFEETK